MEPLQLRDLLAVPQTSEHPNFTIHIQTRVTPNDATETPLAHSGNNTVATLGLLGMGYRVATARVGNRREERSKCADDEHWQGLQIDFDDREKVASGGGHRLKLMDLASILNKGRFS